MEMEAGTVRDEISEPKQWTRDYMKKNMVDKRFEEQGRAHNCGQTMPTNKFEQSQNDKSRSSLENGLLKKNNQEASWKPYEELYT